MTENLCTILKIYQHFASIKLSTIGGVSVLSEKSQHGNNLVFNFVLSTSTNETVLNIQEIEGGEGVWLGFVGCRKSYRVARRSNLPEKVSVVFTSESLDPHIKNS